MAKQVLTPRGSLIKTDSMLTREGNNRYEWSLLESFEAKSDVPLAPGRRGAFDGRNKFLCAKRVIQ